MAAPSGTVWGSIVDGSSSGRKGRIGIYTNVSSTNTQTTVNVQVWFWTIYSCADGYNNFYFDVGTGVSAATTLIGAVDITHTVATGEGWNTANQTKLIDKTYTYNRGTSDTTYKVYAKYNGIDMIPSGTMYANTSYTVPKLTSYTVSYNANGGTGAPSSQTKTHDKTLTLSSTKPSRANYTFQGWATSSSGSVVYAAGASYTANASVTLYAVWKGVTYSVSYDLCGGTGTSTKQTYTYGGAGITLHPAPTKTNYKFLGWSLTKNATTASYYAGQAWKSTNANNYTLYAVWELAYIKPRITGLSVDRCDSDGTLNDAGMYARVKFNWATDYSVTAIKISWKLSTVSNWGEPITLSPGGTSGSTTYIAGNGALDGDHTYDFRVEVHDSNGSSYQTSTLAGITYILDVLANGNGVAIGKPAERDGILEIGFPTRFSGGVNGNLHVNGGTTSFPDLVFKASYQGTGVDFNNYKTSGFYGIYGDCLNGPKNPVDIGILVVIAYTSDWLYQEFIVPTTGGVILKYARTFYNGTTWSEWKKFIHNSYPVAPKISGDGNYSLKLGVSNNADLVWIYQSGGSTTGDKWFSPVTDGAVLLGASSYRWGQIYSKTSSISTSDRNQKKDFVEFDKRYEELFAKLKPQLFKFKDGTSDRKHSGFISQDVEESMYEVGITDKEFAGFCKDIKQVKVDENESTGEVTFENVYDENGNPVYNYSLRYEEFIALNTYMIQKQQSKIEALTSELTSLRNEVQELKSQFLKTQSQFEGSENV